MKVITISGQVITLQNERGETLQIQKDVLISDSFSADHYEKEVHCTMTELSEILQNAKDTIFKVVFRKKIDEKLIFEKLSKVTAD